MNTLPQHASVSSAEIVRQFGRWQDHAAKEPVVVTHHGRWRIVLVSADRYRELTEAAAKPGAVTPIVDRMAVVEQLMEHFDQGFIAFRADMIVAAVNGAACAFLKVQRDAILHRTLEEHRPGIEDTLGYASLVRAARSGSSSTFEMPSFAYDGRWLLFQTFPLEDGAACLFRDITDEMEARAPADAKTAALAAMAAHAGIARVKLSVRGTMTLVDDCFAAMVGFTPEGLTRARLIDVLATRCRSGAADAVEAVLEGGAARAIDVALLTRSGAEREVRIGLSPLRGPAGAAGAVAILTERPTNAA